MKKYKVFISLFLSLMYLVSFSQTPFSVDDKKEAFKKVQNSIYSTTQKYIPFRGQSNKLAYIDSEGKELIGYKYDYAWPFEKGCAMVQIENRYGIIDYNGKEIVPIIYDKVCSNHSGLFIVELNEKRGVFDVNQKLIVPIDFDELSVGENFIIVKKDELFGVYNLNGKQIAPTVFQEIMADDNGDYFRLKKNNKYGVIDHKGKVILDQFYDEIYLSNTNRGQTVRFSRNAEDIFKKFGFITHKGYFLSSYFERTNYGDAYGASYAKHINYLIKVKKGMKWGFLNLTKGIKTALVYDFLDVFEHGYAINKRNGKYGVVNDLGVEVVKNEFEQLNWLTTGKLQAYKNGSVGVLTTSGQNLMPLGLNSEVTYLDSKSYLVKKKGKYGISDSSFNEIIPYIFTSVVVFDSEYYLVEQSKRFGLFSKSGELILPIDYDLIQFLNSSSWNRDGRFIVQKDGKFGIVNDSNQVLVPFVWDKISQRIDSLIPVTLNGKLGFINVNGEVLLKPDYDEFKSFQNLSYFGLENSTLKDTCNKTCKLAEIRKSKYWGLVDQIGRVVLEPQFDNIYRFVKGFAVLETDGRCCVYDQDFKEIVPPLFSKCKKQSNGFLTYIKETNKYGFYSFEGSCLLSAIYDQVLYEEQIVVGRLDKFLYLQKGDSINSNVAYLSILNNESGYFICQRQDSLYDLIAQNACNYTQTSYDTLEVLEGKSISFKKREECGVIIDNREIFRVKGVSLSKPKEFDFYIVTKSNGKKYTVNHSGKILKRRYK